MKRFLPLLLTSSLFAQSSISEGGFGVGFGEGGISFSLMGTNGKYFGLLGGNVFNGRNEDITYDFSPELFDDSDRGDLVESVWFTGGIEKVLTNNMKMYVGGGFSITNKYFKRYDSMEILGQGDGIYYIENDKGKSSSPTVVLGMISKMQSSTYGFDKIGIFLNLIPFDATLMLVTNL